MGAVFAGLGTLVFFASLQSQPATTASGFSLPTLAESDVAVPVEFRSSGLGSVLRIGSRIDVIAPGESGSATIVAANAIVLEVPRAGGFGSSSAGVVLLGVPEFQGAQLAAANSPDLSFVIRSYS